MLTALYLILSALFVFLVWQVSKMKRDNYVLLLLLVLAGLFYDTLINTPATKVKEIYNFSDSNN